MTTDILNILAVNEVQQRAQPAAQVACRVDVHVATSLHEISAPEWNACFPDALEDYQYMHAVETAGITGFAWQYVTVREQGKLLAVIPAFTTSYLLDTTLDGRLKVLARGIKRLFPTFFTLNLACFGSPVTECGAVGFHPELDPALRPLLLREMVLTFERYAAQQGCKLFGLKDVPLAQQSLWREALHGMRYKELNWLPGAAINIDFANMEAYFATLSAGTRKDMRRKLKQRPQLRIEYRTNIDDVLPQVMALYQSTRDRADMQLEELTPAYFKNVLAYDDTRAFCTLYYAGTELLAANLLLKNAHTLLDKFFCMDARGRDYNLYFISWFTNIEYCLAQGLTRYETGQAAYANKLRLGSTLLPNAVFFKHSNRLIQGILRIVAPLFAEDAQEVV